MSDPTLPPEPPTGNQPQPPPVYQNPPPPAAYQGQPTASAPVYGQAPAGQQPYAVNPAEKYNVLSIVSLVSAFFISLVAVITGHIALGQIKKTGEKGHGLAVAGLILGYLGIVAGIIVIIGYVVLLATVGTSSITTY